MKCAYYNQHWLTIDENNYKKEFETKNKIHLIHLNFDVPTITNITKVINNFPSTKRYIISNNIKWYNVFLKGKKKFYVMNNEETNGLLSFFRKNNKVLLNFTCLNEVETQFILCNMNDTLRNVEVIMLNSALKGMLEDDLYGWNGNVLLQG